MADGFNVGLLIVAIVVAALVAVANVYVIVCYQHPEDRNQAWLPKLVVLLGLCVAVWSVLLIPLDVANSAACPDGSSLDNCDATFPMETLWYIAYFANIALVFLVIPFAYFYYEADQEA